jgi:hypothetical protein
MRMQHQLLLEIFELHARELAAGSPRVMPDARDDAGVNAGVAIG